MLVSGKLSQATMHPVAAKRYAFQGRQVACRTSRAVAAPRQASRMTCRAEAATAEVPVYKGDLFNTSYYPTGADAANLNKNWYIIDAKGQTLGRLATLAATYVRGKHMPTYTPSMDMGAFVIVINADQVEVTGNKAETKGYFRHVTGRPGAWRMEYFKDLQKRIPERIVEKAVHGMLPKGRLGRRIKLHLKVFKGDAHPHIAQQPTDITHLINTKPSDACVL